MIATRGRTQWRWVQCYCHGGLVGGADGYPQSCPSCGGGGYVYVTARGARALYPGGPFIGRGTDHSEWERGTHWEWSDDSQTAGAGATRTTHVEPSEGAIPDDRLHNVPVDAEQRSARIAQYAVGTADSPGDLAQRFDVDEEDVEEILGDFNVEPCPGCGWWVESGELADENGDEQHCVSCRDR